MTQYTDASSTNRGPEGSIFLPKTEFPEREFESWHFQLLTGRGIAVGKEYPEIQCMAEQLEEARLRHIGNQALNTI